VAEAEAGMPGGRVIRLAERLRGLWRSDAFYRGFRVFAVILLALAWAWIVAMLVSS
jgi:hypothetical protein